MQPFNHCHLYLRQYSSSAAFSTAARTSLNMPLDSLGHLLSVHWLEHTRTKSRLEGGERWRWKGEEDVKSQWWKKYPRKRTIEPKQPFQEQLFQQKQPFQSFQEQSFQEQPFKSNPLKNPAQNIDQQVSPGDNHIGVVVHLLPLCSSFLPFSPSSRAECTVVVGQRWLPQGLQQGLWTTRGNVWISLHLPRIRHK